MFVLYIARGQVQPQGWFWKLIRRWYFLFLLMFIYQETGGLAFMYFPFWMDNGLAQFEFNILGFHPTLYLQKFNIPILNEYFMMGYFAYFVLVLSYAAVLISKKMYHEMDMYMSALVLTFLTGFFIFYFFPIAGPRFLFVDLYETTLDGWLFVPLVDYVIKNGAAEGGSMPSTHTAIAVVILIHSWRYHRKVGLIYLPIIIGLLIGTFWGRFHFVSDTIVGFILAVICVKIVDRLAQTDRLGFNKLFKKRTTV